LNSADADSEEKVLDQAINLCRSNHRTEAKTLLKEFVKQNPHDMAALKMLADVYLENGEVEDALSTYKEIDKVIGDLPKLISDAEGLLYQKNYERALAAFKEEQYDNAETAIAKALTYCNTGSAHLLLYKIYSAKGFIEKASMEKTITLKLDPSLQQQFLTPKEVIKMLRKDHEMHPELPTISPELLEEEPPAKLPPNAS